jgi:hypothetical protein
MAINLEKTVFRIMDKKLKKEVKKDVSEFKLFVNGPTKIVIVEDSHNDGSLIVLKCESIVNFEYPENSKKNTFEQREQKRRGVEVEFGFNYNNKTYKIYGLI